MFRGFCKHLIAFAYAYALGHNDRVIVTLIAAVARNHVIGNAGELAWRDKDDLRRVKDMTIGKTLVMGRRTFESIGPPLSGRRSIVVSRRTDWAPEGVTVAGSIAEALAAASDDEVFCFGGGEIYTQMISDADRLEITEIAADLEGDVHFPEIDPALWRETDRVERNSYSWVTYSRRDDHTAN